MPILPLLKTAPLDPDATKTLASAFDAAWNVMRRSSSTLAADDMAIVTREVLAKRILALARTGERDQQRLVNCKIILREVGQLRANGNGIDLDQTRGPAIGP